MKATKHGKRTDAGKETALRNRLAAAISMQKKIRTNADPPIQREEASHPRKVKGESRSGKDYNPSKTAQSMENEIGKQEGECSQKEDWGRGLETHK